MVYNNSNVITAVQSLMGENTSANETSDIVLRNCKVNNGTCTCHLDFRVDHNDPTKCTRNVIAFGRDYLMHSLLGVLVVVCIGLLLTIGWYLMTKRRGSTRRERDELLATTSSYPGTSRETVKMSALHFAISKSSPLPPDRSSSSYYANNTTVERVVLPDISNSNNNDDDFVSNDNNNNNHNNNNDNNIREGENIISDYEFFSVHATESGIEERVHDVIPGSDSHSCGTPAPPSYHSVEDVRTVE